MLGTVVQKFNAHFTNSRYTLARKPPRSEKPQSIRALWPPRRGFKNRLLMNVPRPGAYKLAPSSREGESKNAVPSKGTKQMLRRGHRYSQSSRKRSIGLAPLSLFPFFESQPYKPRGWLGHQLYVERDYRFNSRFEAGSAVPSK